MNKKSLFLVVTVSLCQVQISKAPEWLDNLLGRTPKPVESGHRVDDDGSREPKGHHFRTNNGGSTGRPTNVGSRVTPTSGTPGSRGSGGLRTTTVEVQSDPGRLDAREMKALENLQKERVNFSKDQKKSTVSTPDGNGRINAKIKLIENVREQLDSSGLNFADLKECEGLPSYKLIEDKINVLYEKIVKMSIKERIDMKAMGDEITNAVRAIKEVESKLAAEYYKRASDDLIEEVSGANKMALETIRLKITNDLALSSKGKGKPLTLTQVNKQLNILRNDVRQMKAAPKTASDSNLSAKKQAADEVAKKYKK